MRGMEGYYQSCMLWLPCWAMPLLHPPAPPLPHLPQFPLALLAWQMLICSKWEERTESKTRVVKYNQLCGMEPLYIIIRWHTLFLKTQMIVRWCTCMPLILEEIRYHFYFSSLEGHYYWNYTSEEIRSNSHWRVPWNRSWSKYHSVLYYVFDHLSKTTFSCQRKGTWCTFSGWGPTSLSYKASAASYPLKFGSKP